MTVARECRRCKEMTSQPVEHIRIAHPEIWPEFKAAIETEMRRYYRNYEHEFTDGTLS